jgi:hypothetical protein
MAVAMRAARLAFASARATFAFRLAPSDCSCSQPSRNGVTSLPLMPRRYSRVHLVLDRDGLRDHQCLGQPDLVAAGDEVGHLVR